MKQTSLLATTTPPPPPPSLIIMFMFILFNAIIVGIIVYFVFTISSSGSTKVLESTKFDNAQVDRVYKFYVHPKDTFPLRVILVNDYDLLENALLKAISSYNKLDWNFFEYVQIDVWDRQPDTNYMGNNYNLLCEKYKAKIAVAMVKNNHVHGSFEANQLHPADVLAHAAMPSDTYMFVCLDIQNRNKYFMRSHFLKNIIIHELGHSLGLGEIEYNLNEPETSFLFDEGIENSIMCSFNLTTKVLRENINNVYDRQSLKILYGAAASSSRSSSTTTKQKLI